MKKDIQQQIQTEIAKSNHYHAESGRLMHLGDDKPMTTEGEFFQAGIAELLCEIANAERDVLQSQANPGQYAHPEELQRVVETIKQKLKVYKQLLRGI